MQKSYVPELNGLLEGLFTLRGGAGQLGFTDTEKKIADITSEIGDATTYLEDDEDVDEQIHRLHACLGQLWDLRNGAQALRLDGLYIELSTAADTLLHIIKKIEILREREKHEN